MQVTLGQRYVSITVAGRTVRLGEREKLAGATTIVLIMHALLIWGLAVMQPRPYNLSEDRTQVIDTELYRIEPEQPPIPKVEPVELRPVIHQQQAEQQQPPPQPQPQQQQAAPSPPAPQPTPAPAPSPNLAVAPRPDDSFAPIKAPALQKPSTQPTLSNSSTVAEVAPEPNPNLKAKKKQDDGKVEAKSEASLAHDSSDLKLHDASVADLTAVTPSGLTPHLTAGATAGGGAPGGARAGGAAGGGGINGVGLNGRSGVTQALQNHESCAQLKIEGKPLPDSCKMTAMDQAAGLSMKPDAGLQAAAAQRDADLKYKTQAGNSDYWKRVNASPQSRYEPGDGTPKPGQYSNPKDDKVMNGINGDPKAPHPY